MTEELDVLAIAAHPDDAEIGCGGTLILARDAGLRVGIADLTAGERATRGTTAQRQAERDRASERMGLTLRVCLELPDTELGSVRAHREAVIALLRDLRPSVVLAPYGQDRHPDHAAAARLTEEAAFFAGVSKVGGGEPHRPSGLYHYMLNQPFAPSFVVDISRVWERKVQSLSSYESQFGDDVADPPTVLSHGRVLRLVDASATFHGGMVGVDRGEPFYSARPVPLGFLPGFMDVGPGRHPGFRTSS